MIEEFKIAHKLKINSIKQVFTLRAMIKTCFMNRYHSLTLILAGRFSSSWDPSNKNNNLEKVGFAFY